MNYLQEGKRVMFYKKGIFLGIIMLFLVSSATAGGSDRTSEPAAVLGKTWQWVSTVTPVETITAKDPKRYTFILETDGKASIQIDCNTGSGSYTIGKGTLRFGPLISTNMACPPDTQDAVFARDLQRAAIFFIENGVLYLDLPYDSGTMRFETKP